MARTTSATASAAQTKGAAQSGGGAVLAGGGGAGGGGGGLGAGGGGGGGGGGGMGPPLVSMAQAFAGLPMESLIGGPLNAAAEANQQMGLMQINFLMNSCFAKSKSGDSYTPVMVTTSVTRNVIDTSSSPPKTEKITATVALPLFTLLPINTLGVTNVEVDFTMNVSSSYSNEKNSSASVKANAQASYSESIDEIFAKTTIKGSVSVDSQYQQSNKAQYDKKNSATYKVSVSAAQLPLPPGVTTLIQAFTSNITPIQVSSS